ncbi:MAG TPA: S8 family serine peptidase [Gemmatimonadaceae bacterium]|nr:S8 family serine peptidase [Gemmatimonadaceae bacterium]
MSMHRWLRGGTRALLILVIWACGGSESPSSSSPVKIVAAAGSGQTADLGQALPEPLVAHVTTSAGAPAPNVPVTFTVTSGDGTPAPSSVSTDASGNASTAFTMGHAPGVTTVSASSGAVAGAAAVFIVSTGPTIVGRVVMGAGNVRLPALSHAPQRAPIVLRAPSPRPTKGLQLDVVYRPAAMGVSSAGPISAMSMDRARIIAKSMRAKLAAMPIASRFDILAVSPAIQVARIRVHDATAPDSVIRALGADRDVASVNVDGLMSRGAIATAPFTSAMRSVGHRPRASDTPGAGDLAFPSAQAADAQLWEESLIDAPRAWHVTTGSRSVVVAVIDDGINQHPDIVANLDMAGGYDFVQNDSANVGPQPLCTGGTFSNFDDDGDAGADPDATMPMSVSLVSALGCWNVDNGANHGLHVAGIIGAGGNPLGIVSGVDWTVTIRPVRALGIDGSGYFFDIAQAVLYAAGLPAAGANGVLVHAPNRAPIINMSLGGTTQDPGLARAVASAIGAGSIIVAAAGNSPSSEPAYPAAYPGVIAVAALGPDAHLASYSSSGSDVSLVAPGGDFRFDDLTNPFTGGTGGILSTTWDFGTGSPSYTFYAGTSMAAPQVSGVAALVLAANPGMSASALRTRLLGTAMDVGPVGPDDRYGSGIVDAYAALTGNQPPANTAVRAIDATTGAVAATGTVDADGSFVLTRLPAGSYYVVAGQDEAGDGVIGFPGRRMGWAGGTQPSPIAVDSVHMGTAAITLGAPVEQTPNGDRVHAQQIFVDSWIAGSIGASSTTDYYRVLVPTAGPYTVETSGVLGACGLALELNTTLTLSDANNATVAANDNSSYLGATGMTFPGTSCSKITATLAPGAYTIAVGWSANPAPNPGSYRLQVRSGS